MTRKSSSSSHSSAAAVLSAGVLLASSTVSAQGIAKPAPAGLAPASGRTAFNSHIKFEAKLHKEHIYLSVAGMLDRRPVFKNPQGEFFQVDPSTGDLQYHTAESLGFMKMSTRSASPAPASRSSIFIKFDGIKGEQRVSLVGVDPQGNVIQENDRKERFYLGPNGDMVFVK